MRFVGDTGYVVTFRQIDPLHTLDLADPSNPRVLGELKIPGYSAYLHPIGEDLLLGVGQDATSEGRPLGTQLSVFDVSNLRKPTRLYTETSGSGWSEAENDHHAFLYWPRTGLLMIPFNIEARASRSAARAGSTASAAVCTTAGGRSAAPLSSATRWSHCRRAASCRARSRTWPSAAGRRSRRPRRRARSAYISGAEGSVCQRPKSFPLGSVHVANQPMLGTGIGSFAEPPSSFTFAAPALMSSTVK